ncbi:hypothetical protein S40288_02241 [Stachybotrys chartarum IBT 40288]|nr:hypothetical protein S40288_02241 [Stachybotrys chartarum IBT 40288]
MDHYNATVHNGALVSTRRGLHVSKTKHQGTRFVNTFAAPTPSTTQAPSRSNSRGSTASTETRPHERKFKFVAKPRDKGKGAPRGRPRASPVSKASTPCSSSESGEDVASRGETPRSSPSIASASSIAPGIIADSPSGIGGSPSGFFGSPPGATFMPQRMGSHIINRRMPDVGGRNVASYFSSDLNQPYLYEHLPASAHMRGTHLMEQNHRNIESTPDTFSRTLEDGATSSEDAGAHFNKLYNHAGGGGLYGDDDLNEPVYLESIASKALVSVFMGSHEQWHAHMKNLRYLISRMGGMKPEWGQVLSKIRKADVKGAAYTGTTPYLDFTRFFPAVSDILNRETKTTFSIKVQHLLQACGVVQDNIDSVSALVHFVQSTKAARHAPGGSIIFEPHGYIEEFTWIEQLLVRFPGPLRDEIVRTNRVYDDKHRMQTLDMGMLQSFDDSGFQNHLSPSTDVALDGAGNLLDSFVRLTAILYMEELLPESYTVEPYSFLLSMLGQQTRAIVTRLRARGAFLPAASFNLDGLPQTMHLRPLLIWGCMVAYAVAKVAEVDTGMQPLSLDISPYQDCVGLLIGSEPGGIDGLTERDFDLCNLLHIQELRTVNCDDRSFLRQMVVDHASRQLLSPVNPYI